MRIAIVAGGRTPERDVSLRGGHRVATALASLGHDTWTVDPSERKLVEALRERPPDLCWLALHGKEGEDGTVQRLLDLEQVPYTGTRALDCELTFDKVLAKDVMRRAKVPTPDWVVIEGSALRDLGAGASLATVVESVAQRCCVGCRRRRTSSRTRGRGDGGVVVQRCGDRRAARVRNGDRSRSDRRSLRAVAAGRDRPEGRRVRLRRAVHRGGNRLLVAGTSAAGDGDRRRERRSPDLGGPRDPIGRTG